MKKEEVTFRKKDLEEYPRLVELKIGKEVIALEGTIYAGMKGRIVDLRYDLEDRGTKNPGILEIEVDFDYLPTFYYKVNFQPLGLKQSNVNIKSVIMSEEYVGLRASDEFWYSLQNKKVCELCGKIENNGIVKDAFYYCKTCHKIQELLDFSNQVIFDSKGLAEEVSSYDGKLCEVLGFQLDNVDIRETGLMFDVKVGERTYINAFIHELHLADLAIDPKHVQGVDFYDLETLCRGVKEKGSKGLFRLFNGVKVKQGGRALNIQLEEIPFFVHENIALENFFIQNNISVLGYLDKGEVKDNTRRLVLLADTNEYRQKYYATVEVEENDGGRSLNYFMDTLKPYKENIALVERIEGLVPSLKTIDGYVRTRDNLDCYPIFRKAKMFLEKLTFQEAEECIKKLIGPKILDNKECFLLRVGKVTVFDNKECFGRWLSEASIFSGVVIELTTAKIVIVEKTGYDL